MHSLSPLTTTLLAASGVAAVIFFAVRNPSDQPDEPAAAPLPAVQTADAAASGSVERMTPEQSPDKPTDAPAQTGSAGGQNNKIPEMAAVGAVPAQPAIEPVSAILPATPEELVAFADSETPAEQKRATFFAAAATAGLPDKVRRAALNLGLRRLEPAAWPATAGKLIMDKTQPAWMHDALAQDMHARGHEMSLPWFEKIAADPGHRLYDHAAHTLEFYRKNGPAMQAEIERSDRASKAVMPE